MPAAPKIVGVAAFVVAVALTPRWIPEVVAVQTGALIAVIASARLDVRTVGRRMLIAMPFVLAAILSVFVGSGPRTSVLGIPIASHAVAPASAMAAKALLGTGAGLVLSATTPMPAILNGLSTLRMPAVVVAIMSFTVRYLDIVSDDLARMRRSMTVRGHSPRWLWQLRPIAGAIGVLFVRSYERGERIHQAMLARGYNGAMPSYEQAAFARTTWIAATMPAMVSALALAGALVTSSR